MRSKRIKSLPTKTQNPRSRHVLFFPLLLLTLGLWTAYRFTLTFPVWFDEVIGKALLFGLPVWLYVVATRFTKVLDSVAVYRLFPGLLQGVAIGGVFGFAAAIVSVARSGAVPDQAALFMSDRFWYEFALALFTAFWETLLFFSLTLSVLEDLFPEWDFVKTGSVTAAIYLIFHLPNIVLRYPPEFITSVSFILFFFALGQSWLFIYRKNAYALMLSHAIWGMVLLVHSGF